MKLQLHLTIYLTLTLALAGILLLYYPGLKGSFLFDDYPNIITNTDLHIRSIDYSQLYLAANSYGGAIWQRPISMTSFALNYLLTGLDPYFFKITNLVIHISTTAIVFILTWLLMASPRFASVNIQRPGLRLWVCLLVSFLWGCHPINLTSVLYVVQRMTLLSGMFVFAGLAVYTWARLRIIKNDNSFFYKSCIWAAFVIFTPLAFLSKENGILLPFFILLVELAFFARIGQQPTVVRVTLGLFVVVPAAIGLVWLVVNFGNIVDSYQSREFSFAERVLTQSRVVLYYLRLILVPQLSELALFHDDFVVSKSIVDPISTLISVFLVLAMIIAGLIALLKKNVLGFGILFFFTGHLIESTILPLEMVHEHRNYVASFGIVFVGVIYLFKILQYEQIKRLALPVALCIAVFFAGITHLRARTWSNIVDQARLAVEFHPDSGRSRYTLARVYWMLAESTPEDSEHYIRAAQEELSAAAELNNYHRIGYQASKLHLQSQYSVAEIGLKDLEAYSGWLQSLSSDIVSPFSVMALNSLLACVAANACKLDRPVVAEIGNRVLDSERIGKRNKGRLLANLVNIELNAGNIQRAITLAQLAYEYEPEHVQHLLNLSYLYIVNEDYQEADRLLRLAESKTNSAFFREKVEAQRARLQSRLREQ